VTGQPGYSDAGREMFTILFLVCRSDHFFLAVGSNNARYPFDCIVKIRSILDVARVEIGMAFMEQHSHVGDCAKTLDIRSYGLRW
jgi:hypothetical protein